MELRERASGPKADLSMRPARSGGGAPTGSTRLERAYRLDVRAKILILRERVGLTVRGYAEYRIAYRLTIIQDSFIVTLI
jgi:hypothetical protein